MEQMSNTHIEYAGGHTLAQVNRSRGAVIDRAPKWWRQLARDTAKRNAPAPAQPAAMRPAQPATARRWQGWGWVCGVCAPGVSTPIHGTKDRETIPEQFTPRCWESILRSIGRSDKSVRLTLGHRGPTLATSPLDLTFRVHRLFGVGMYFTARLKTDDVPADVARALQAGGVGVSVGYTKPNQWIVERSGVGRVRVIDECTLDHVALLSPGGHMEPVYAAARCFGLPGPRYGCPSEPMMKALQHAYRELKRQAGVER